MNFIKEREGKVKEREREGKEESISSSKEVYNRWR